jgi:uncharacterized protein YceH (UPF0502 family)
MDLPELSLADTRVLGVLVEKQHTVPDTYPLSLNALVAGCNQKTSRDPVLELTEAQVQASVDAMRRASLVVESSGGRVMRYAHNLERALDLPPAAVALLATLMLRGPQTVAELRANTERMHRFADASAVEGYLEQLAARAAGALAVELSRVPGARETRWMHLLSGAPHPDARADGREPGVRASPGAASGAPPPALRDAPSAAFAAHMDERIRALERDVATLVRELAALRARLTQPGGGNDA